MYIPIYVCMYVCNLCVYIYICIYIYIYIHTLIPLSLYISLKPGLCLLPISRHLDAVVHISVPLLLFRRSGRVDGEEVRDSLRCPFSKGGSRLCVAKVVTFLFYQRSHTANSREFKAHKVVCDSLHGLFRGGTRSLLTICMSSAIL